MSTTVDERVVEMRFDNKQFESNVQTTLSTLDKLKQSLNLTGAAKGIESVTTAAKDCNMTPLVTAVENVRVKFSALEIMAITALQNITNSAINTGKRLVSSLTIDQVTAGWDKYADKTSAVQTIMAATAKDFDDTGEQMEYVNAQLEKLNWFTDETSYNFLDMVNNIGKFTSNNIPLEKSVTAMQGISTWAAISGANTEEAGRAMYNLSQAIAVGAVKLQDWKSIENANMATSEFKQTAIDTAVAMGTLKKNTDGTFSTLKGHKVTISDFNTALSDCWFSSEVLMKTLDSYGGFANGLYEVSEKTGRTATELLSDIEDYKKGTLDLSDISKKTGISVSELTEMYSGLSEETFNLGERSFRAAQEAKTFGEAIDSVKDAVSTGWMNTFELIFGNYEEAKVLWTDLANAMYDAFASGAEARNALLSEWKDLGGRDALIEAFWNAWEGVSSIIEPIKEAFRDIFPATTAEQLYKITNIIKEFTANLKVSDTTSKNLKNTFKGLFAVLDIVKQAFSAVLHAIAPLFGGLKNLGSGILGVTGNLGEWLTNLDKLIKENDVFGKAIQKVIDFVKKATEEFGKFIKEVKEKFNLPDLDTIKQSIKDFLNLIKEKIKAPGLELIHSMLERIHERMSQVGEAAGNMKSGVKTAIDAIGEMLSNCKFLQVLQALWNGVKTIGSGIAKALGGLMDSFIKKMSNADFSGIIDLLNGLSIGGIALAISKFFKSLSDPLDGLSGMLEKVTGILDGVRGCFEAYQTQLKAGTMIKIASAIAILAASIIAISMVDSDKLSASLGAITIMFADLLAAMAIFNKMGGSTEKGVTKLIVFSGAVLILSSAVKKMSDLDWEQLAKGLVGVGVLLAEIDVFMKTAKFSKGAMTTATGMVILSAAIKILASIAEDLSNLSWEQLGKGLVGVLLAEIDVFLNTAKFSGKAMSTATGIVILSAALKILASVCKDFSVMKWDEIGKGLASIGALLGEIAIFTNLTGNAKHVISTGIALVAISGAMKIFASAMSDFGAMKWDEIGRGLTAIGVSLAEVALATKLMPKNMIGIGTGLVIVGAALEIIANVMSKLGDFSWEKIGKGLAAMGGALAELAIGLNFMKGTLGASAAVLVAASALAVLAPVISILGAMSWISIAKGLVTIAGAFTVLGVAGAVLRPLVPTILGLSGAFALIGVGVLAIGGGLLAAGAGLSALAVGFTALAAAGAAGATAIVASLTVIITGVAGLIPAIIAKIGEGIIMFCKVIAEGAPAIGVAIKEVVLSLVGVLVECVPAIADGALALIAGVLEALVTYTPQIVDSIFHFLIGVLEGIAKNLPGLIKAAIDVLMAFFSGIVDALSGIDVDVLLKGIVGIGLLSAIMVALSAVASLVPGAMLGVLGMGLVIAELALVLAAVGALAQIPGLSWLIGEGGTLLEGIGTAIGKFVGGIVGGFMSGVSSQFPQIGADLSAFMVNVQPFLTGASSINPSMMDGVKALAETILILTAADILQGLTSWLTGGSSLSDFATQLVPFGNAMKDFSIAIAGMDADIVANAATAGKTLAEMAATLPNTGGVVGFFAGENDMNAFGEQLVPFGEAMMAFSVVVAGMDANAVTNAAIAGKAMAEMATTIPNTGGVVGFFAGENDMDAFGEQLVPFGEAMMNFSNAVKGLDADTIVNSATAGKALIELANTIPNSGGLVSFFTGENDMDTFGNQLVPFGEAMKSYSDAISGIDVEAVVNSATAGKAIVELANTLPNTGGLVSWFTGDNDIAAFGTSLVSFGNDFAQYSDYMKTVDSGIVVATTNAANSIVELQKSLPKEGGWFSDDMTLASFGSDMASFGSYFSSFYNYISGVDTGQLSNVISQTNRLVDMANGMAALDTSGMSGFGSALTALGQAGIDGFINAFNNANSRVTTAASNMLTTFINAANAKKGTLTTTFTNLVQAVLAAINNKQSQFNTAGSTLMIKFIAGVRSQDSSSRSTFTNIVSGCLTSIKNKYTEFQTVGQQCMIKFIAGVRTKDTEVKQAFTNSLSGAVSGIKDYYNQFYDAGSYLVDGFCKGISDNDYKAAAKAKAMAKAAADAAAKELDEHSPSKVGYRIGDFFGVAFVNAIGDYVDKSYKAGSGMAEAAKNGLNNAISKAKDFITDNVSAQPIIRPVLDLSNVEADAGRLNAMLSRTQAMSISSRMSRENNLEVQNGEEIAGNGSTFNFTQNNYSPKALSRVEIYRQTKNQFSAMERMVEA